MKITIALSVIAAAATCGAASAAPIITFGYTDLAGRYIGSGTNGTFSAAAVNVMGGPRSDGNVTRLTPGPAGGTATFAPGFVSAPNFADFNISISVNKTLATDSFGTGGGSFTIVDVDGDRLEGLVSGMWITDGTSTFFNGSLSNVNAVNVSGDGEFNGNAGRFLLAGLPSNMNGSLVQLFFNPAAGFFQGNFDGANTGLSGQLVPTPGALALLGLGGLAAARRRRA